MPKVKIADYVVQQLVNLGITDVFGLPGDFNFKLVEAIERHTKIEWRGCTNELNAGYAADGYARAKGYGALVTTFGVGELSAINAVAGSYAESVPVVKIVGIPTTKAIRNNLVLHHNFEQPDYYAFEKAYSNVVETTAFLDEETPKEEIDRVFSTLINEKKPVYLAIPVDVCEIEVDEVPQLDINISDSDVLNLLIKHAKDVLNRAEKPVIVADILAKRFQSITETKNFIEKSGYPVTTFLMGKGLIDSDYKGFLGTYLGRFDNNEVYDYVNSSDCIISIGAIYSDLNTSGFDIKYDPADYIQIFGNYTIIENCRYDSVLMKDVLNELAKIVPQKKIILPEKVYSVKLPNNIDKTPLSSSYIFPRLQELFKENDIIFSETGIIQFGLAGMKLPKGAEIFNQILWGSIGWSTPAAMGAALAAKDRRIILVTGEGSHQLTAMEVSSMMRYGLKPIIIVLNNDGYTIERILSDDPLDKFNDIAVWNYSKLPSVFEGDVWVAQARTKQDFDKVLKEAEIQQKSKICYIEIFADKMDYPELTKKMIDCNLKKTKKENCI